MQHSWHRLSCLHYRFSVNSSESSEFVLGTSPPESFLIWSCLSTTPLSYPRTAARRNRLSIAHKYLSYLYFFNLPEQDRRTTYQTLWSEALTFAKVIIGHKVWELRGDCSSAPPMVPPEICTRNISRGEYVRFELKSIHVNGPFLVFRLFPDY
jgi:hypothetical protein